MKDRKQKTHEEVLSNVLQSGRFVHSNLNAVERELSLAERDLVEGKYDQIDNDIFRAKYAARGAYDEFNSIDGAVREALGLPRREYRKMRVESDIYGREKKNAKYAVVPPTSSAITFKSPSSASKVTKTHEMAIGPDSAEPSKKSIDTEVKKIYSSVGTDAYDYTTKPGGPEFYLNPTAHSKAYIERSRNMVGEKFRNQYATTKAKIGDVKDSDIHPVIIDVLGEKTNYPPESTEDISKPEIGKKDIDAAVHSALSSHPGEASSA